MKCKASRKFADDSRLLDGMSKHGDNAKEKTTKSPKRSTVPKHSFASRTKSLQSSHSSENSVLLHKEKSQSEYQNDAEKEQRTESSQDILQQSSIQIPSAAIGITSTSTVDASKTCQGKIQECNLSRKRSSGDTIQDFTREAEKKGSHTDVTSTNHEDISAERSDITATHISFLSKDKKDKSLRKRTQNFVRKSASKSFCSEIAFPKNKSTSMSAKKTNIFRKIYSQKYSSSGKKLSYTTIPIPLKKHHFDSKSSIESSKNDDVFVGEHERNVSLSSNTILPELKTYPEVNNFTDESQNAATLEKHIQIHVNSELLIEHVHTLLLQPSIKKDINSTKINLEFKDPQETNNLSNETNSKEIIKRKISFENLDQNTLPLKKRKKMNEMNTSPAKVVADNIEISNYEILSDDELVNADRRNWQSISKRMIREKENYKLLMRQREQRRKKRNKKIKEIREKFREYFRGRFDPHTSESEEEREILSNYLKRKRQQLDDLSYDTTEEEIEDILKRDKKLSHNRSANNLSKNVENAILAKIKSDNLCDSTEKYTMHDEEVEDGALICKRGTFVNNLQDNIESKINSDKINSDNLCDSIACTESYYATTDEEEEDEISTCKPGTPINNSQENIENAISGEINSNNSCDTSACTEKYYSTLTATTDEEIEDEASICKRVTSVNNSQENIESAISGEMNFNNSCDSSASTEKYHAITDEEIEDEASICKHDMSNNLQENIDIIPNEVKSYKSCDSTTTDKKIKDDASTCKRGTSANNLQENIESAIPAEIKCDNSCDSTTRIEKYYFMHDTTTDEKIENRTTCKCDDISVNNSQGDISAKIKSVDSCDSTACVEKNYAVHDATRTRKIKDGASICKYDTLPNNLQENIESAIPAKEQHVENSSPIVVHQQIENSNKNDARAEHSEDILSTIEINVGENMSKKNIYLNQNVKKADTTFAKAEEINMQAVIQNQQKDQEMCNVENVELIQYEKALKMQKRAISNLELSTTSAHESTLCNIDDKDGCDVMQNINILLTSNSKITRDAKTPTIDQSSVTTSKLERKLNDNSLDRHVVDNDNNSDIEVEIKIKPKSKSRVLGKEFSLKAPWSAVNTCIKNLHTLKNNPSFLNEFFELNHDTSEKSMHTTTDLKSNVSLDDNRNVTAENEEIIYDSSPTKNNVDRSQQHNFQDCSILNKDRNTMDRNQRERDECKQPVEQKIRITKNNLGLSEQYVCNTSDLGKQLQNASMDNKQKTNEEQKSRDNITLEGAKSMAEHNQGKEDKLTLCIEQKKMQMAVENSPELMNTSQLISPQSAPLQSIRPQLISPQSPQSTCSQLISPQSTSQLISPQSTSQLISPQSTSQLISPQSAPLQSIRPQLISPQSTSQLILPQSVPFQSIRPQVISPQSTSQLISPQSIRPQVISPQSTPQSIRFQLISPQSAPLQSMRPQLISPQSTYPQLIFPQLTSAQSIPKRPFYNPAVRHIHSSSKANAPAEINHPTVNNEVINLSQIVIKRICANVAYCRDLIQYKFLSAGNIQIIYTNVNEINKDLEKLRLWLNMDDIECVITYINQYMHLIRAITVRELKNYINIAQAYVVQTGSQQYDAKSNTSQYPNVGGSVPNASMPSVNAQSYLGNTPVPGAKMPNRGKSSKIRPTTRPAPMIQNIKQQQLFGNLANSPQVPYSRQSMSNIHQQYTCCLSHTTHSYVPNVNQQQSLGNASHPVQSQYMPSIDMMHVGNQPVSVNIGNISSTSTSNTNMHSYRPVNQWNTNASLITNAKQLHVASKNTINNTATASAANGQQKQMYFQMSQMNSNTICSPPTTNQNIPLGTCHTVQNDQLPGFFMNTPRTAVMGNVRHESVNQQQATCNRQVSQTPSEKTQSNCYLNSNKVCYVTLAQSVHCNMQSNSVQNILPVQTMQQKAKNSQRLILLKDPSIHPVNLSIPSQDVQQNVLNKGAEIPKSQNKDSLQKNVSSTNRLQDVRQEIPSACNISQNTAPNTSTLQRLNVFQNTMSSQKDKAILPKSIWMPSQTNEVIICNFNLAILTDIQKIVLSNQIYSYLLMPQLKCSFNKQEIEQIRYERRILCHLYQTLRNYIKKIIEESKTDEKHVEKNSVLQESTIQISINKLTKTQSNENSSACNRNLEKQSSEQSVDINTSKNSKSTTKKNNLEARKKESLLTAEFAITKESLPEDTRLQEQNKYSILKTLIQKSSIRKIDSSIGMDKESENTEISSPGHSKTPEENSITKVSGKNSETKAEDNAKIDNTLKASSYEKQLPEFSVTRKLINLLRNKLIKKKTENQLEIAKSNVNNISNNVETESVHGTFNVATLKSNRENHATLRSPCNTKDQNKEIYNASNEISNENLQNKMHDVGKNIEILNTEIQSDPLNIPCSSLPSSLNNMLESISPINKCKSTEVSEHTVREKHVETILEFCLNAQQEDFTNEQNNDSIDETSESSEKLIIDESMEKSQEQEQCDKVSFSEEDDLSTSQDSARLFNMIRCKSPEVISPLLKNITEAESADICQNFETETKDTEKLNKKSSLEAEEMQLQELKIKDTWIVEETTIQSIDTTKEPEDTKEENSKQSLLKVQEMQPEEMSLNFEDEWNVEESTIQSIDISKELENTKEENSEQSLLKVEEMQFDETSLNFEDAWSVEESTILSIDTTKESEDIGEESNERSLLEVEETQLEETSLNFEHTRNIDESTIHSIDTTKESEDTKEENSQQSLLKIEEMQFDETSLNFEDAWSVKESTIQSTSKEPEDIREKSNERSLLEVEETQLEETLLNFEHAWSVEENTIQSIDSTQEPEDIKEENSEQSLLKVEETQLEETSLNFEHAWSVEESTILSIDTTKEPEDTKEENSEQSLSEVEQLQEMSLLEVPKDASSMEESIMQSIYLKIPENIEEEIDTHSSVKTISEQLKHVSEHKYYEKPQIFSSNLIRRNDLTAINVKEVTTQNDIVNADIVECISLDSDDSEVTIIPNILNIRSISSSSFETINNTDMILQNDSETSNEKSIVNNNLGNSNEVDYMPCLRCKRKSTVYCQACLEAHYCSKRCASLYWNTKHYKQCKGRNSIIDLIT